VTRSRLSDGDVPRIISPVAKMVWAVYPKTDVVYDTVSDKNGEPVEHKPLPVWSGSSYLSQL